MEMGMGTGAKAARVGKVVGARARRQDAGPVAALTTATSIHGTLGAREEASRGAAGATMATAMVEERAMVATATGEEKAMVVGKAGMAVAAVVACAVVGAQVGGSLTLVRATTAARSSQFTAWSVGIATVCRLQCSLQD